MSIVLHIENNAYSSLHTIKKYPQKNLFNKGKAKKKKKKVLEKTHG